MTELLTEDHIKEAAQLFRTVVVVMAAEHQAEGNVRNGAALEIRDTTNETRLALKEGEATDEAFAGYVDNVSGKNDVFEKHPEYRASWQVHEGNTTKKPYPGAIRSREDDRIAISGFSWERDTVGCLWIAYNLGRIGIQAALDIAKLCGIGDMFKALYTKLNAAHREAMAA